MYFDPALTDVVRLIGEGRLEEEARAEFKELIAKYGEARMKAAAAEIAERVPGSEPSVVRLTAEARRLAIGLIGRPKEPEMAPPESRPTPEESPSPATDPVPEQSAAQKEPSAEGETAPKRKRRSPRKKKQNGGQD